ncbi:MAG TPA: hypothetical protein VFV66_03245 [Nonomuraea sp.]|nr:hypothetical protein [Nonomuraea sp.]
MERPLSGELVEQGLGVALVEARGPCRPQDAVQVTGAVDPLDPPPDGSRQAGQDDGAERVGAVLEGLLVAEDAPEGGLHTWPHGGKVGTAEQDPEPVPPGLWITKLQVAPLWITAALNTPADGGQHLWKEDQAIPTHARRPHHPPSTLPA